MELRTALAIGLVLLPALAPAQGTAQRPGTVRLNQNSTNDTATAKDFGGWIEWKSSATSNKTQYLPNCDAKINGATITVVDGQYNAAQYPIDVKVQNGTSYVDGAPGGRSMQANGAAMQLVCDGAINGAIGNWIVLYDTETGGPPRVVTQNELRNLGNITNCTPGSEGCNCDQRDNGQCSMAAYEDTLRGTDDGSVVIYRSVHNVDVGLPRNTPHGAFRPGWMTTVANDGPGVVRIRSLSPSTITGSQVPGAVTLQNPPANGNGGTQITLAAGEAVNIYAEQTLPNRDFGPYYFLRVANEYSGKGR